MGCRSSQFFESIEGHAFNSKSVKGIVEVIKIIRNSVGIAEISLWR